MKQSIKLSILLVGILSTTFALSAQEVKINPKFGVNISGIEADIEDIRTEARAGWNAGLDFRIGKGAYLAPGIHYYSYSANLRSRIEDIDDFRLEDETTIQSLKLPVNLGFKLLGLRAQGGIVPTYVTNVNQRENFDFDIDKLNRLTWGANVGVGMDLLFLTIDASYEIGLSDYFKDVEGRNNVLTLSAGIKF